MFFNRKKNDREIHLRQTYSQCGEDSIIDFAFGQLKISHPVYMDIGAHHPFYLSNTALFYLRGCKGVSIEPDPSLYEVIRRARPDETSLKVGLSDASGQIADFYIMSASTLNTFSKSEAERYASYGNQSIREIIKITLLTVNEVIEKYMGGISPNFVSLDIEGMDLLIVKSFDFAKYRPEVLCIETLSYTEDNSEKKLTEIIAYVEKKGYFLYADTYINSIFVDKEKWKNR